MNVWNTIVIVAGTLLLLFICRREIIRVNKARLVWRILASVLAVVCLVCMGLPLTVTQTNNSSGTQAIVVTEGANDDSVQQFNSTRKEKLTVYQAADLLSKEHLQYDSLHVFGYGFSADELQMLDGAKLIIHPSPIINGITAIDWSRKVEKGRDLVIQGTYANRTASPVTILLNGFNTILDTFIVPAKQDRSFQLHTVPRQNGKAVYRVLVMHEKDTLENEPVPIEVITPFPIKVLMLAASPDFENKFLKNWLSQNGYTVVTRTAISTNKFDKTFLNAGNISLDRITSSLLDSFDVLVSDETAILSLTKAERENIYSQVTLKGLGVIIRSDTIASSKEWYSGSFGLYGLPGKQPSFLSIHIKDGISNIALPVEQPVFIRYKNGMQPLVTDSANNILAGMIAEGAGKIIFNTVNNTYSLLLAGKATSYYSLWSVLLQKAAREQVPEVSVETSPALPVVQQPLQMILETGSNILPVLEIDNKRIALAQNEKLAYRFQGIYWPSREGWQPRVTVNGMINNSYVYNENDWKYISAQNKINATGLYSRSRKEGIKNEAVGIKSLPVPVPRLYFFVLFIICCGFLWMERKLF